MADFYFNWPLSKSVYRVTIWQKQGRRRVFICFVDVIVLVAVLLLFALLSAIALSPCFTRAIPCAYSFNTTELNIVGMYWTVCLRWSSPCSNLYPMVTMHIRSFNTMQLLIFTQPVKTGLVLSLFHTFTFHWDIWTVPSYLLIGHILTVYE